MLMGSPRASFVDGRVVGCSIRPCAHFVRHCNAIARLVVLSHLL